MLGVICDFGYMNFENVHRGDSATFILLGYDAVYSYVLSAHNSHFRGLAE
jgi:hypothetical protein